MILAIDIDEVLADFSAGLVKYYKKQHGIKLRNFNIDNTEWWQAWGGTKEGAIGRVYEFVHSNAIMAIKPIKGSRRGIKELKKLGHDLLVVTGRPMAVLEKTVDWLERFYPKVFRGVYSTDFHIVNKGKENKGDICARKGVKLMIDDYYAYCLEALEHNIPTLLYSSSWNKDKKLPTGMTRVNNWQEIVDHINHK